MPRGSRRITWNIHILRIGQVVGLGDSTRRGGCNSPAASPRNGSPAPVFTQLVLWLRAESSSAGPSQTRLPRPMSRGEASEGLNPDASERA